MLLAIGPSKNGNIDAPGVSAPGVFCYGDTMQLNRKLTVKDSSQITEIEFSPVVGVMVVTFQNGASYRYAGLSAGQIGDLITADSIGKHFSHYIRPFFDGKKIDTPARLPDRRC